MSVDEFNSKDWCVQYNHYSEEDEGHREALLALGNGFLVSRAASPEASDDGIHYPGTYKVGCYNRLVSNIEGKEVENDSLVNLPNWLSLNFRIDGGNWFSIDKVEILAYHQKVNMKAAVLTREVQFRDEHGRQTRLLERRFVSMDQPHLMALEMELTSLDWAGTLEVISALDGKVANNNVKRYAPFNNRHLEPLFTGQKHGEIIEIKSRTRTSGIEIAIAARTKLGIKGRKENVSRKKNIAKDRIEDLLHVSIREGETVIIEKIASVYTSKDFAIEECGEAALKALDRAGSFDVLLKAHANCWEQLWSRVSLHVENKDQLFKFRLHFFQIVQNLSLHTADLDVGVPPSGWQGEEYHGQIFWDELFVLPFLSYSFPTIARSMLMYRYRRLDEAKIMAKEQGFKGAMFPWRSASTGKEETPLLQFNLLSKKWMTDNTYLQRHINAILAFNICQYYQITGDRVFMIDYGLELILEIARFWASIARLHPITGRYEIHGVVGPDEYHTQYLEGGAANESRPGIDNNSYTNIIASWTLRLAGRLWKQLSPAEQKSFRIKLAIREEELSQWERVSRNMRLIFHEDGILTPFEGFETLKDFEIEQFRKTYGKQRVDWTLDAMGDTVERYKISKQADTSLLLFLFSPADLIELINHMGYEADVDMLERTVQYDIEHTAHESTLSRIVHAGALSRFDSKASWIFFQEAQQIDLSPGEEGTSEGIHLGAMGGTLYVLQHHFMGIRATSDGLEVKPSLPAALGKVRMRLFYRGVEIECEAEGSKVVLRSVQSGAEQVKVRYRKKIEILRGGGAVSFG